MNGEVRGQMPAAAYFKMKRALIPEILSAYNSLAETVDIIVIEGAGSPAEINLKADDIVNMGLARLVDAPFCWRETSTGAVCSPSCTARWRCWSQRSAPASRGCSSINSAAMWRSCAPALLCWKKKTQLPVLGVVPYLKVDIEDEDSLPPAGCGRTVHPLDAAILRLPHISNFTDFMPLEQHPLLGVRYVQNTRQLGTPDLIILPGTKNTVDDLLWLRQSGLEAALLKLAANGTPVLGVCGGYQMLGETLPTPKARRAYGADCAGAGAAAHPHGLTGQKHRTQDTAAVTAAPFAGAALTGYQIHTGRTEVQGVPFCTLADDTPEGCVQDNVFGTYLHGLFDTGALTEKLVALLCRRKGIAPDSAASSRWSSTASSSLTCWPMACAARWIWMPFTRPMGWRTRGGMHNDPTTSSARRH